MRWKKRHMKRFDKIIKTYYSSKLPRLQQSIHQSLFDRRYPECLSSPILRQTKNMHKTYAYDQFELFLVSHINVPVLLSSKVKRSRVQNILTGYLMISIDDLNRELGTSYTLQCLRNYEFVKSLDN